MRLLKALSRLRIGSRFVERYRVFPSTWLKPEAIQRLVSLQRLWIVNTPPIAALWPERAKQLEEVGIETFEQLLMASAGDGLALEDSTLAAWQREAVRLFEPVQAGCKHCGGK